MLENKDRSERVESLKNSMRDMIYKNVTAIIQLIEKRLWWERKYNKASLISKEIVKSGVDIRLTTE